MAKPTTKVSTEHELMEKDTQQDENTSTNEVANEEDSFSENSDGDDHDDDDDDDDDDYNNKRPADLAIESNKNVDSAPKKAKIAMPPAVSSSLVDVEKYELDSPLSEADQPSDEDTESKITSSGLILFGLHPLVRESPLKKMCEEYGVVVNLTVRSTFASRYGHVEFESVDAARKCYQALNGAKLLHKAILVQPSKAETKKPTEEVGVEGIQPEVVAPS
ncbi:RNA recognition motif containing protein [Nitzschia inconspicua]|uniref:RNA recognition motif containing protein n=1 Tax=Nitzschia inconspicua TaxID=303405 RepID=A0A9K3PAB5_9STRA|nr:RNA recognition motif containing protein [Nitzschia inconspicua]KAG7339521.1 RNA recognition motif containing protein [Nitzschia inconspicua]KAG7359420.1 RNA recognition motif containing protein [Nitzschia inconspicua]